MPSEQQPLHPTVQEPTPRSDRRRRLVALALTLLLIAAAVFVLWWGVTHPVGNVG